MRLIGDFFEVLETSVIEAGFITTIELNPKHIVYSGHFPGHPVTPGVIQAQIVHELLEKHFSRKLRLKTMEQCKFLKILNPNDTPKIAVHIEFNEKEELVSVKAWGEHGQETYFKLNATYHVIPPSLGQD